MFHGLKTRFRRAAVKTFAAGIFAAAFVCFVGAFVSAPAARTDCRPGAVRNCCTVPCAAILHQAPEDFALRMISGRERPRPPAPRHPSYPAGNTVRTAVEMPESSAAIPPPVNPGKFHCDTMLHAAQPPRAGPVPD